MQPFFNSILPAVSGPGVGSAPNRPGRNRTSPVPAAQFRNTVSLQRTVPERDGFRHRPARYPAKFGEVISPVTGAKVPLPPRLAELVKRPRVSEPMAVDLGALEEYVAGV